MNGNDFMDSMNQIDEKLIKDAERFRNTSKTKKTKLWVKIVATAACISLIVSGVAIVPRYVQRRGNQGGASNIYCAPAMPNQYLAVGAVYPEEVKYSQDLDDSSEEFDAWFDLKSEKRHNAKKYTDKIVDFYKKTASDILKSDGKNAVYSPLNVYFALSMLAETTSGQSREQILELLGEDDIKTLRTSANELWKSQYKDDATGVCLLANSLWLSNSFEFKNDVLNTLADNYYASSFYGSMTDEGFNSARREWINTQTGGLLEESVNKLKFDPQAVMSIASTINFKAKWQDEFNSERTYGEVFHSISGDVKCDFMHKTEMAGQYMWGENFSAAALPLAESGEVIFILPDEGISPEELLNDSEVIKILGNGEYKNTSYPKINYSIPKFDVMSDIDLKESLEEIGISDIFDFGKSDFSPLTDESVAISSADHSARVTIDEEGVTAVSFVSFDYAGASLPQDEVDFKLDRPFLFVITGLGDIPLFVGVVNQIDG